MTAMRSGFEAFMREDKDRETEEPRRIRAPSRPYVFQDFPKWVTTPHGEKVIAQTAEDERRLTGHASKPGPEPVTILIVQPTAERRRTVPNRDAGRAKANAAQATRARAFAIGIMPVIAAIRDKGVTSLSGIAKAMNGYGIPSRGGGKWGACQALRLIARAEPRSSR